MPAWVLSETLCLGSCLMKNVKEISRFSRKEPCDWRLMSAMKAKEGKGCIYTIICNSCAPHLQSLQQLHFYTCLFSTSPRYHWTFWNMVPRTWSLYEVETSHGKKKNGTVTSGNYYANSTSVAYIGIHVIHLICPTCSTTTSLEILHTNHR